MREIVPAILEKTIPAAQHKLDLVNGLAQWVQIDIMDGVFVPNKTISIADVAQLKTDAHIELHLMIQKPWKHVEVLRHLRPRRVLVHYESFLEDDSHELLFSFVHQLALFNIEVGLAINPETSLSAIKGLDFIVKNISYFLFMTVHPGFGGQALLESVLRKIHTFRQMYPHVSVEVDGGVKLENISYLKKLGVNYYVIGSSLFKAQDVKKRFQQLQQYV